ncbi:hypothetical protein FPV67DRAFT_1105791 [Lyophyllum atratum]|nr:hypothetical protein FPV67DRAFT_1105791 [Lyophyllum atratum]
MKVTGTGSKSSPIAIDDSEEEVLQELVGGTGSDSNASSPKQQFTSDSHDKPSRHPAFTGAAMGHYQNAGLEGKRPLKRKRVMNDGPIAGPSQPRQPLPHQLPAPLLSKKAKKRRRKMERQAVEAEALSLEHQTWTNALNRSLAELVPSPMMQSWPINGMGHDKSHFEPEVPSPFSSYSTVHNAPRPQYPAERQSASSSAWVTSMTMAAESPAQDSFAPWEYPFIPKWPDFLQSSSPPPTHHTHVPSAPQPTPKQLALPVPLPAPPPALAPAPAPPPAPLQSIGMKPDQDPSSKHGLYQISAGTASSKSDAAPYIPNPARTLVMEQLPKPNRTKDFVNSWSKSACGAYPVYLNIDPPAAKALVEFATAELARKAWSSPRLGSALVGLKTHQLKGRPREDLIKVWWYRVDGVGANAGVGEIEEGEIEGDATEQEIEVPVKKETKKERKARLAQERQLKQERKQKKVQNLKPGATLAQTPSQAKAVLPAEPTIPKEPVIQPMLSLPPNPTIYSASDHNHTYYSAMLPPLAHPLPQRRPPTRNPAPTAPPLPPQSALETLWRPRHELPRRPPQQTLVLQETRAPQHLPDNGSVSASIASSRSLSPAPLSPQFAKPKLRAATPTKRTASPGYEDMEVEDDMELESPKTLQRAHLDFASSSAPVKNHVMTSILAPAHVPPPTPALAVADEVLDASSFVTPRANHGGATSITTTPDITITPGTLLDPAVPPPASITPPVLSASPPLEPRATRGAPKGPSYAKRSLLARHKELAERIAQSKMELGLVTTTITPPPDSTITSTTTPAPDSTINSSVPTRATSPIPRDDDSEKRAMEDRLRSLVLKSQRNKVKMSVSTTPSTTETSDPSPISSSSVLPTPSLPSTAVSSVPQTNAISTLSSHSFSLDDLAVSFITETIEIAKAAPTIEAPPVPSPTPTPTLASTANMNTKLELAAKHKRLEAQIAESKALMVKLTQAKTKQERESILAVMRERSRCVFYLLLPRPLSLSFPCRWWRAQGEIAEDEDGATAATPKSGIGNGSTGIGNSTGNGDSNFKIKAQVSQAQIMKRWPGSHERVGVLIVSDDEEDDRSDGA